MANIKQRIKKRSRLENYLALIEPWRNRKLKKQYNLKSKHHLQNTFIETDDSSKLQFEACSIGGSANKGHGPCRITMKDNSTLIMRERSCLRAGVTVEIFGNTTVELGKNSYINYCSNINAGGRAGISIGAECAIAWNVQIISYDYHAVVKPDGTSSSWALPINIGDHCWIGAGATILKGVTLGSHSIVAAGAVLTNGNYPDHSLIAGNPGRIIREGVSWRNLTDAEKTGL